jgi:hypothetical protein
MKKILIPLYFLILIFVCYAPVLAVSGKDSTTNKSTNKPKLNIKNWPQPSKAAEIIERNKQRMEEIEERKSEIAGKIKNNLEEKCLEMQRRIKSRNQNYLRNGEQYVNKFDELIKKMESVISKLDEEGCNTTQLKEDLKTVKEKVQTLTQALNALSAKMGSVEENICKAEKPKDYLVKANEYKNEIKTFRSLSLEIRNLFKRSFAAHYKEIRNTCSKASEEKTNN